MLPILVFSACAYSPKRFPLCDVAFRGERGWAFGGAVYSSWDGGETWMLEDQRFLLDPDEMPHGTCSRRVAMIDDVTGFHTLPIRDYADGYLKKTEDGCRSWVTVNDSRLLAEFFFRDAKFGLAYPGLKTVDGGLSWREVPEAPFFGDVCFFTDGSIFVVAGRTLWKSEDQGESWSAELTLPKENWPHLLRIQEHGGQLWISGTESFFASYDPETRQLDQVNVPASTSEILDFAFAKESVVLVKPASLLVRLAPSAPWKEIPQPDSVLG